VTAAAKSKIERLTDEIVRDAVAIYESETKQMSDVVERARARNMPYGHLELIDKLADEVERLTAERAGDQQRLFHYEAAIEAVDAQFKVWRERAEKAEAEIEHIKSGHDALDNWQRNALREIARLQAALKPFSDYADKHRATPPELILTSGSPLAKRQLTMRDCYNAADALQGRMPETQ